MKNPIKLFKKYHYLVILLFLSGTFSYAQDLYINEVTSPQPIENNFQPITIAATISNASDFGATEPLIEMVIIHNGVSVFNSNIFIPVISAGGIEEVSSQPTTYTPTEPGVYTVSVYINYAPDNNLGNNHYLEDFMVEELPVAVNFELYQVNMINPFQIDNSTYGVFEYVYVPSDTLTYLNAVATLPGDMSQIWIVKNLPMLPHVNVQTISYWFDLGELGVPEGLDVSELLIDVQVSEGIVSDPFVIPLTLVPHSVLDLEYNVFGNNLGEVIYDPIPLELIPFWYDDLLFAEFLFRGCIIPNIDLENDDHPSSDDYAGDTNACGPAAAANSMKWLEDTHPDIEPSGSTLREILEEMSLFMDREPNAGVTTTQLINGKLDYIDANELPIHVKFQSWWLQDLFIESPTGLYDHIAVNHGNIFEPTPPTWEFYKNEMDNGEDVEILFGWYDIFGFRHGGHWVTGTGYYEDSNGQGIFVKDDSDQAIEGGTSQTYHEWYNPDGFGILGGYSNSYYIPMIESVVSESYDSTITFDTSIEIIKNYNFFDLEIVKNPTSINEPVEIGFTIARNSKLELELYNSLGQLVYQNNLGNYANGNHSYLIENKALQTAGSYILLLKNNHGENARIKMLRE